VIWHRLKLPLRLGEREADAALGAVDRLALGIVQGDEVPIAHGRHALGAVSDFLDGEDV
jgi:hypothetical protein